MDDDNDSKIVIVVQPKNDGYNDQNKNKLRRCFRCNQYKQPITEFYGSNRICNICKKEELDKVKKKPFLKHIIKY